MGRYLSVGIATKLRIDKEKAIKVFGNVENAIVSIRQLGHINDIFYSEETADYILFKIKPNILLAELHEFTKAFYKKCYDSYSSESFFANNCTPVINKLATIKDEAEMVEFIKGANDECFLYDEYWESDYIERKNGEYVIVHQEGLTFAYAGKIVMESYGPLFSLFEASIAETLSAYKLSKAIRVVISG